MVTTTAAAPTKSPDLRLLVLVVALSALTATTLFSGPVVQAHPDTEATRGERQLPPCDAATTSVSQIRSILAEAALAITQLARSESEGSAFDQLPPALRQLVRPRPSSSHIEGAPSTYRSHEREISALLYPLEDLIASSCTDSSSNNNNNNGARHLPVAPHEHQQDRSAAVASAAPAKASNPSSISLSGFKAKDDWLQLSGVRREPPVRETTPHVGDPADRTPLGNPPNISTIAVISPARLAADDGRRYRRADNNTVGNELTPSARCLLSQFASTADSATNPSAACNETLDASVTFLSLVIDVNLASGPDAQASSHVLKAIRRAASDIGANLFTLQFLVNIPDWQGTLDMLLSRVEWTHPHELLIGRGIDITLVSGEWPPSFLSTMSSVAVIAVDLFNDAANRGNTVNPPRMTVPVDAFQAAAATLEVMDFSNNRITQFVPGTFAGLTRLQRLFLHNLHLSALPAGLFADQTSLAELALANNQLQRLPEGLFNSLTRLEQIFLDNNALTAMAPDSFAHQTSLTSITLSSNKIVYISEELFSNTVMLEKLFMDDNAITALPDETFRSNTRLTHLSLHTNMLTNLSPSVFAPLTRLVQLALNNNGISELHPDLFSHLTQVEEIWLGRNQLSQLPAGLFQATTNLRSLFFESNVFTSLPLGVFDGLTRLEDFRFQDNRLRSIPPGLFNNLTRLRILYLHINRITAVDEQLFSGLSQLTGLWLQSNQLRSLPPRLFSGLSSIADLRIFSNLITVVPAHLLDDLTNLERCYISNNVLSSIPEELFHHSPKLFELVLNRNQITALPPTLLRGLTALKDLWLNENLIPDIPRGFLELAPSLQLLHLANNKLPSISRQMFKGVPNLQRLWLGRNLFTSLPHDAFAEITALTFLNINSGRLQALPQGLFNGLRQIFRIEIGDNSISELPSRLFSGEQARLQTLDLRDNVIRTVGAGVFPGLVGLHELWLSGNAIASVHPRAFEALSNMRVIFLNDNVLTSLPQGVFDSQTSMTFLWLIGNRLTSVPAGLARNSFFLQAVYLSENRVTTLPSGLFQGNALLRDLLMHDNDLHTLPDDIFAPLTRLDLLELSRNPNLVLHAGSLRPVAHLLTRIGLASMHTFVLPTDTVDDSSYPIFERMTEFQLQGTAIRGNAKYFFSLQPARRLRAFSVGWADLDERTIDVGDICRVLADRGSTVTISPSAYKSLLLCNDREIATLRLMRSPQLTTLVTTDHDILDVSNCPKLSQLIVDTVSILEISNTNVVFSEDFCVTLGRNALFGRNMLHPSFTANAEPLLRNCFTSGNVFDFSNNAWLRDLTLIRSVASTRTVLGEDTLPEMATEGFADTRQTAAFRDTIPLAVLEGTPVTCRVDMELVDLLSSQRTVPAYTISCDCAEGHRQTGNICVSTALSTGEIIAIAWAAVFVVVAVASPFLWKWYKAKQRERYLILQEKDLQEQLLGEELESLKKGWQINLNELDLVSKVDEGAFGEVWKAQWDGLDVAVKFLKLASFGMLDQFMVEDFDKEVDFLQRTRHPNLVRFFGTGMDKYGAPFLVLEFVDLGSLRSLLTTETLTAKLAAYLRDMRSNSNRSAVTDATATSSSTGLLLRNIDELKVRLATDVAKGMAFLHSLNVMHRDLKSGNVLVTKRLVAKITDFGSMSGKLSGIRSSASLPHAADSGSDTTNAAMGETLLSRTGDEEEALSRLMYDSESATRTVAATMTVGVGTPLYMAPEVLDHRNKRLTLKADVFSFGVLMWEIYMCDVPDLIEQEHGKDFKGFLANSLFLLYEKGKRLIYPERGDAGAVDVPEWYVSLSKRCMDFEPSQRPSFNDIVHTLQQTHS